MTARADNCATEGYARFMVFWVEARLNKIVALSDS